jgi:hypothetical protein
MTRATECTNVLQEEPLWYEVVRWTRKISVR